MILSALVDYYERLVKDESVAIPELGYSQVAITATLILDLNGRLIDAQDLREQRGKKLFPKLLTVPQPKKRASDIAPSFLWDKSSYVLGVSNKVGSRTEGEHAAFKALHREWLINCNDDGLTAVLRFLEHWQPEQFAELSEEKQELLLDANLVFRLDGVPQYVHESVAARSLRAQLLASSDTSSGICLVTGREAPLSRLHPSIKGVVGAQSSGASIVSFNLESFTSYGKVQGDNAPVSDYAAFAYTTALNYLLRPGSHQRLLIGDTTVVFWAHGASRDAEQSAEDFMAAMLGESPDNDDQAVEKVKQALDIVTSGRPLTELDPRLDEGTSFYVLGSAPNAARLSIRFWLPGTLGDFARRLAEHHADLHLEPLPRPALPSARWLALVTAPYRKKEGQQGRYDGDAASPLLAGELMRAVLSGQRYPISLLGTLLMRMRADGGLSGSRISLIKAVLTRTQRLSPHSTSEEIPVSLDPQNRDPGYVLGRLFAELESAQRLALGKHVNATIRDRYYGAASATPATVFGLLLNGYRNHLSRLRKDRPGAAVMLEKEIGAIFELLPAEFPKQLSLEAQGRFAIGYYHQTQQRFQSRDNAADEDEQDQIEQGA